jgi:hypothetical protein
VTKEKLEELRERMLHHAVVKGVAYVVLTARELGDLLECVEQSSPPTNPHSHHQSKP